MKKILLILAVCATAFVSCSQPKQQPVARVHVEGNQFIDPQGNPIVFRGLCFSDPVKLERDGHWNEEYFAKAAEWGANIVRFAVHPQNINSFGWDETFAIMDKGMEWARQYGLYVIMDWHSIGNLKDARFTSNMYVTDLNETLTPAASAPASTGHMT